MRESLPIRVGDRDVVVPHEDLEPIAVRADHGFLAGPPRSVLGMTAVGVRMSELGRIPRERRFQHDALARVDLGPEDRRTRFQDAEHVSQPGHPDAADVVAHSRLVVECDPGEETAVALVPHRVVVSIGVVEGLMLLDASRLHPVVERRGTAQRGDGLADEIRTTLHGWKQVRTEVAVCVASGVVVVVAEDVVLEDRVVPIGAVQRAARRRRRVQRLHESFRSRVEVRPVRRFVQARAPDDDGRPMPVTLDHLLDVVGSLVLPVRIADVLPAGRLLPDK